MTPNAFYFLGEGSSWGTEAIGIYADSGNRHKEEIHVSNQAGLSSQEALLMKVKMWSGGGPSL